MVGGVRMLPLLLQLLLAVIPSPLRLAVVVTAQEGCIRTSNELNAKESLVTDVTVVREYTVCDNALWQPGALNSFHQLVSGGMDLIQLRPNLHLKCGTSGSRANGCRVNAGSVQLHGATALDGATATTTVSTGEDDRLDNVIIEGLTFSSAQQSMIWITKPGNVIFRDCEFRENTAISPILLDYYNPLAPTTELHVTFDRCSFADSTFVYGSQATLIIGNSRQNRLTITDCQFSRNNMVFNNTNQARSSSLIETSGPIEVTRSCFTENFAGVAPIVVYTAPLTVSENFADGTSGALCPLAAVFGTSTAYSAFTPTTCSDFDVTECRIGGTLEAPSPMASVAPVAVTETNTTTTSDAPSSVNTTATANSTLPPNETTTSAPVPNDSTMTFSPAPTVFVPSPSPSLYPSASALIIRESLAPVTRTPVSPPVGTNTNTNGTSAPSRMKLSANIETPVQSSPLINVSSPSRRPSPRAPSAQPVLSFDRNEASNAARSTGMEWNWIRVVPSIWIVGMNLWCW